MSKSECRDLFDNENIYKETTIRISTPGIFVSKQESIKFIQCLDGSISNENLDLVLCKTEREIVKLKECNGGM
jgi:hypothetical protein